MRCIIIIVFFFITYNNFSQQILMKVSIKDKTLIGYGGEIYYVVNDFDEFKVSLSKISKFTDKNIFNVIKYPLVEPGFSFGICETKDRLRQENSDFFKKTRRIIIEKKNFEVTILICYAFVEFCIFDLPFNFSGCLGVDFKEAAVIISYKKCRKRVQKRIVIEIKNILSQIPD
jgi:hypothetical protein